MTIHSRSQIGGLMYLMMRRIAPSVLAATLLALGLIGSWLVAGTFHASDCSTLICEMPVHSSHILVHNQYLVFVSLPGLLGVSFALVISDLFGLTDPLAVSALGKRIAERRDYPWDRLTNKLEQWNKSLLFMFVMATVVDAILFGFCLYQGSQV